MAEVHALNGSRPEKEGPAAIETDVLLRSENSNEVMKVVGEEVAVASKHIAVTTSGDFEEDRFSRTSEVGHDRGGNDIGNITCHPCLKWRMLVRNEMLM